MFLSYRMVNAHTRPPVHTDHGIFTCTASYDYIVPPGIYL